MILFCALTGFAQEKQTDSTDNRNGWKFFRATDKQEALFTHQEKLNWKLEFADGSVQALTELERTDDHIIMQNNGSKLIYRLTAGRGYWRTPGSEPDDWKTWVKGEWVQVPISPIKSSSKDYVIKLGYFVPQDRQPIPNYDRKIRVIMNIVAELYRDDLLEKGYDSGGFQFELQEDEQPTVHLIKGNRTAGYYNNSPAYEANEQWKRLVPEIRDELGSTDDQVLVVFAETYDNGPADHGWPGSIALGSYYTADGGLGIYTSHILKDAFCALSLDEQRKKFFDRTPVAGRRAIGHSMNSPRCEFVEDGIGAVAHELGHAFGLPHDRRQDDIYIMGNGFRNLRQNFTASKRKKAQFSDDNARLLMSSRYLNPDLDRTDNTAAEVDLKLVVEGRMTLYADLTLKDDKGLRALVLTDTIEGTIVEGQELSGKETTLRVKLNKVALRDGEVKVMAIVTDTGGNQTRVTRSLKVPAR
ncbi:MAG TPA: hypothetical protein VLA12_17155 [Planctomycetaceae bacterium]|nr:hypothetical protein [Planctomycetaceae bacterium]